MKLGIVGLPNVGKSTLFNALTSTQNAQAANYPFCTIEPNSGIVPVPDARLDKLAEIWQTDKKTPAIVEFVDIAGLVKGASQGAGLGNKFLGHIRECDAIVHVVRCFDDDNIIHVVEDVNKPESVDPIRDIDAIDLELILADLEVVARSCHGATIAYLPLGLDAAGNGGTTDFQFRNNFHFPVKIEAETTVDLVKMRILGTDEKDYYIEMTSGYDDSREDVIYAVSYKNKYSKETGELISKDREAFSTYYRNVG